MGIFNRDENSQKVTKGAISGKEDPFKKNMGYRNDVSLKNIGDAKLCEVDFFYKHLIGRCSLAKSTWNDEMSIVKFLRATPNFEFVEICINGEKPEWVKPYPNGCGVDFGCDKGNITVKYVYDDDKDFLTEKVPLDGEN